MKDTIKLICIVSLTFCSCVALLQASALIHDVRLSVRMSDVVLAEVNDTARNFSAASTAESEKLRATTEEARKTERAFRAAIDSLRQVFIDVHQRTLPAIDETVSELNSSQKRVADSVASVTADLQPSLEALANAIRAAGRVLSDPAIEKSLENVEALSEHAVTISASTEATAKDVQRVADKFADQYTKARNVWLAAAQWLFQRAWEVRGAVGF
jgi:hypothetical protein